MLPFTAKATVPKTIAPLSAIPPINLPTLISVSDTEAPSGRGPVNKVSVISPMTNLELAPEERGLNL